MVLPLRVCVDEQAGDTLSQLAHTIDISHLGCRLAGLRTELSPGQTITLQRGQQKAQFRVIWSKHLAANEHQAGIEALDFGKNIWGVEMPPFPLTQNSTKPSNVPVNTPATAVSAPLPFAPKVSAATTSPTRKSTAVAARPRMRWGLMFGMLLLSVGLGLSLYHLFFNESGRAAIQPPVPAPPTADELARLTPKPHLTPVSLARTPDSSVPRLQVAEAPTGHVVYPVAPDDSIGGKVRLQIVIAANGLVKQIYVLSGKQQLAEAAARAVRFWRFSTLQGNDPATERETSVTVSFMGRDAVFLEYPSNARVRTN